MTNFNANDLYTIAKLNTEYRHNLIKYKDDVDILKNIENDYLINLANYLKSKNFIVKYNELYKVIKVFINNKVLIIKTIKQAKEKQIVENEYKDLKHFLQFSYDNKNYIVYDSDAFLRLLEIIEKYA